MLSAVTVLFTALSTRRLTRRRGTSGAASCRTRSRTQTLWCNWTRTCAVSSRVRGLGLPVAQLGAYHLSLCFSLIACTAVLVVPVPATPHRM